MSEVALWRLKLTLNDLGRGILALEGRFEDGRLARTD